MYRRYLVGAFVLMFMIGTQTATGFAAAAEHGQLAAQAVIESPSAGFVLNDDGGNLKCLRGANPCAGYGSENCCGEMEVAATIAWLLGNYVALGIASAYLYAYC